MTVHESGVGSGYAPVNGLEMYYESHGSGGPLLLVHGGFGATGMFARLIPSLAETRRVIAVDLQGHGRTADIDRPLRYASLGDDLVGVLDHLGLETAAILGYSFGGGAALRAALQHPDRVERLVVVSAPFRSDGWHDTVRAGMTSIGAHRFESMKATPMYEFYRQIAPRPEDFPVLMDKVGEMERRGYDWSDEVERLAVPTLIVVGDADSVSPAHAARFFELLGGGLRDAGWEGAHRPEHRLAVLPGRTHYDIFDAPELAAAVAPFLRTDVPA